MGLKMDELKCENCAFFQLYSSIIEGGLDEGRCHRYPPQRVGEVYVHPVVQPDDWCGEIALREKEN